MPLAAERFVGRADELSAIERLLDELGEGRPAALELAGEPGIGKTRFLAEVGRRAEERGFLVLSGAASELEHDLPFSVFVDALDEYLQGLENERISALHEGAQAELARVFPSLSTLGPGQAVALQQERYRSHHAVRQILELLTTTQPLVLVLDDVHWADSASIELLGALLRRPPSAAVLIALAMRPRQAPERLLEPLERASRAGILTRIEIGPLSPAEARAVLGDAVGQGAAAALYEESGGNPFYLAQLALALELAGGTLPASPEMSSAIGVPPAVAAALTKELAALPRGTRIVLQGAAVAGDPFEPELAAAAAETSEATAMDALDELLALDLVRPTDMPRRFRFRHPLIRRAVYETTPAGWRLNAHERCADALAARGSTAASRAHHIERSARHGDLAAVALLQEAGEAAGPLAPSSAARWYGAALRLLPETTPSEERIALLVARARSLAATGRFAESRADLLECIRIVPPDAKDLGARVTTACAAVEHLLGLQTEAHRHLATALADLGGARSAQAVELMIELTLDGFHSGNFDAMRRWAGRAVEAAGPLGDRALLAASTALRAWAGAVAGDGQLAQVHCDEATQLVDQLTDEELARRLDALAHLTGADLYLDRFQATVRHGQRAIDIGRRTRQGEQFPLVVQMLGVALWVQGKTREAGELFDGAVEAARLVGNVQSLAWTLFNRSLAALAAADLDVAIATGQESFELEEGMEPGAISAGAAATYASALLEIGAAEQSVELLLTRVGDDDLRLIGGSWRARFLEVLTRALLAVGRRADAERAAAAAQACADGVSLPTSTGSAWMAAAALALDAADPRMAAVQALAAAGAFEGAAAFWDAARARELAGRALARAGDRDRAARELETAASAFDSFGALRYRDQAERELRKLGRRTHHRTRAGSRDRRGIGSLTGRELEIARLVVDRRTNPEIASALFLSPKTVETHLRNIFNKMNVTSRVALARAVENAQSAESSGPS